MLWIKFILHDIKMKSYKCNVLKLSRFSIYTLYLNIYHLKFNVITLSIFLYILPTYIFKEGLLDLICNILTSIEKSQKRLAKQVNAIILQIWITAGLMR